MELNEMAKYKKSEEIRRSQTALCTDACACRESARSVLQNKIKRETKRVDALIVLAKAIPWDVLSREDEELLLSYFIERDR